MMKDRKVLILEGSPRKHGNTQALTRPFREELESNGVKCESVWLYDKNILPCLACRACQSDWEHPFCVRKDDLQELMPKIMESELLVLSTPIYVWYCTAPMKALLDRTAYAFCKYYGPKGIGPSLLEGKKIAMITTCGYPVEKGADLLEAGIRRYAHHARMEYLGLLGERQKKLDTPFMDEEKADHAREFAREILASGLQPGA
jgi:multimeric flavodoxin WrbA